MPIKKPKKSAQLSNSRAKTASRKDTVSINFPELYGEETESGSMPHPESDDNTLQSIQEWGFDLDADLEHPKQMNLQKQIDKAERARRKKRDIS